MPVGSARPSWPSATPTTACSRSSGPPSRSSVRRSLGRGRAAGDRGGAELERRPPAARLPGRPGRPGPARGADGRVGGRQRLHRRLAGAAADPLPVGPDDRPFQQRRVRRGQQRRPARGRDAVRGTGQQRRPARAGVAAAAAGAVRRAGGGPAGRRLSQDRVPAPVPGRGAVHPRVHPRHPRHPGTGGAGVPGRDRRRRRHRAGAVGPGRLRARGGGRGPLPLDPPGRDAAGPGGRPAGRGRRAAAAAAAGGGRDDQARGADLGRWVGERQGRAGAGRPGGRGPRRGAAGGRAQQRRQHGVPRRLRGRPGLPGAGPGPVPAARGGVRLLRGRGLLPHRGPAPGRGVRRRLLPLLRGHRPVVAAAVARLADPLPAGGGGPPHPLGLLGRVVAAVRVPHRPQPAADADQERQRRPGRPRGPALPPHHRLPGPARGRPLPPHPPPAPGPPDPAAPAGAPVVCGPAPQDAGPPPPHRRPGRRRPQAPGALAGAAMRVGLDATPLLGPRTGVGRYVQGLAGALAALAGPEPEELALVPFSWRGTGDLPSVAPSGPRVRHGRRRAPARLLQAAWARMGWPPVEWLAGPIDVFHATNFVAPPTRRAATVVTIHDLTYLRYPEMVTDASARYRHLVPQALRRGAIVCTPTTAVATEVAAEYGLGADRLVVTPLGVDPSWRQAAPPTPTWLATHGLPDRYLLFVGSREPRKNLTTLLSAYRELLRGVGGSIETRPIGVETGPTATEGAGRTTRTAPTVPPLVLVGPPGWGATLDTAGLPPDAIRTPGYLPQADLVQVVAGASALVVPSWYEGFGLPALEALACGTPVVASDLPALREVLGDQADLVPPGDPAALADALARTLDDPGDERGRAARRTRAAGFTWENCAQATLSAYRLALESRR